MRRTIRIRITPRIILPLRGTHTNARTPTDILDAGTHVIDSIGANVSASWCRACYGRGDGGGRTGSHAPAAAGGFVCGGDSAGFVAAGGAGVDGDGSCTVADTGQHNNPD